MVLENATLHYFAIPGAKSTVALGENVNLFLKDAGVDFKYVRHGFEDFKESDTKKKLIEQNHFSATLPAIEIDGKFYNKTVPTMKLLGKKLDKYIARNDQDEYFLDVVADVAKDYLFAWLKNVRETDEEKKKEHVETTTKKFLGVLNDYYGVHQGPYLLGSEITYSDFLVYHIMDDDNALGYLADYPNLQQFVNTFTQRPNLTAYFTSLKEESK